MIETKQIIIAVIFSVEQFDILNKIPEVRRICLKFETEGITDYVDYEYI